MFWVYGDNVVKRGFPMVGVLIIAMNVLVWMYQLGLWRQDMEAAPKDLAQMEAFEPERYDEWYRRTRFHQFIERWGCSSSRLRAGHFECALTNNFLHGDTMHLAGNMLMLWALLGTLEISLGPLRFLGCYLFWGVVCSLPDLVLDPSGTLPSVGASGAIAGMIGAYLIAFGALTKIRILIFFPLIRPRSALVSRNSASRLFFNVMVPTSAYMFFWVMMQILGMEAESSHGNTGVAWGAHVGGFLAGVATMLVFRRGVLRKMIRNRNGELQVLDEEELAEHHRKLAEKAERMGLATEEDEEGVEAEAVEEDDAPKGVRPWHVILAISGVFLLAAVFIATRKDPSDQITTVIPRKDTNQDQKAPPAEWKGKPLTEWVGHLKDDNISTRRDTAKDLCSIDPEQAPQLSVLLAPGLQDEDGDVRQLSAYVLSNIKLDPEQAEVVSALEAALRDKNKNVRRYASTALVKIGISKPEKLVPVLQAALADSEPDVRKLGLYIYQNMDPDGTKTALFKFRVDLLTARDGFTTKRVQSSFKPTGAAEKPPAEIFQAVHYPSPAGDLVAYVTPDPGDGKKHPAVLWAHGGFSGIGSYLWLPRVRSKDQSARAFREAGFVLMCPSWRNENDNPAKFELFYGEVNDLLAARDYLAELPYVDPERIYLAGHSTGGTLTLLAATATDKFRAAFSFGGAPDMHKLLLAGGYNNTPFDPKSTQDVRLRSATLFTPAIRRPTFYFEGEESTFNQDAVDMEERAKKAGAPFRAFMIKDGNHFDILDPITRLVARKILQDAGDECKIAFSADEVQKAFAKRRK